jgi:hypothetical protein
MALAKTEDEWAERAARNIKAGLKRADMTYDDPADAWRWMRFNDPAFQ